MKDKQENVSFLPYIYKNKEKWLKSCDKVSQDYQFRHAFRPEIYIQSAPNNSNETYTFMCLGEAGRFGQC